MKLVKYLLEEKAVMVISGDENDPDQPKEIATLLKRDCSYYMGVHRDFKKMPLYKGLVVGSASGFDIGDVGIKNTRVNRTPKGMDMERFKAFNKWLELKGHVKRDNSISLTSVMKNTFMFGTPYMVFPIGRFDYTWVKSRDVNLNDQSTKWDIDDLYIMLRRMATGKDVDKELVSKVEKFFHTNKGIGDAIYGGYEIWMNPKQYYIMLPETFHIMVKDLL